MASVIRTMNRLSWLSPEVRHIWSKLQDSSTATPTASWSWLPVLLNIPSHGSTPGDGGDPDHGPIGKLLAEASASGSQSKGPTLLATVLTAGQLLVSVSTSASTSTLSRRTRADIERQHLELGVAAELLRLSQLMHGNGISASADSDSDTKIKLRVLAGDFCITRAFSCLARIEHGGVTRVMMECLAGCAEQNFEGGGNGNGIDTFILQAAVRCAAMLVGAAGQDESSTSAAAAAVHNLGHICAKLLEENCNCEEHNTQIG